MVQVYQKEESEIWIGEWLKKTGQYAAELVNDTMLRFVFQESEMTW